MDMEQTVKFRQGDNATVAIELGTPLNGNSLKVGIYSPYGKPLYETKYPGGDIVMIDETHLLLEICNEVTHKLQGPTTLRLCEYAEDRSFVNSGESYMTLVWEPEPVNENLI